MTGIVSPEPGERLEQRRYDVIGHDGAAVSDPEERLPAGLYPALRAARLAPAEALRII